MPSGLPLKREVSFLLIQAEPTSGRRLSARLRLYLHSVAAPLWAGLIQALARMGLVGYTFGFLFIAGIVGQISLSNSLRFLPANKNIDHPSRAWRIFYRLMAFSMCAFWSFFLTCALLGALPIEDQLHLIRDGSELAKAAFILLMPLPLLPVRVLPRNHGRL